MTSPQETTMSPADLKPHPLQQDYFDDAGDADLQALADDLRDNGQRDPIHVMPPDNAAGLDAFTILDGNQRTRAAKLAGLETVRVLIRHDLIDADAATVEAEFLKFNVLRRQLRPLQKARIAMRLFLIEKGRPPGTMRSSDAPEARDRVGKALEMSGRNLARYFNVLRTPLPIQNAVDRGLLPLVLGSRVANLSPGAQQVLAGQIEAMTDGKTIASVVSKHLGIEAAPGHRKPNDAFAAFARQLGRGLQDLDGRLDQVSDRALRESLEALRDAQAVISHLIGRVEGEEAGHGVRRPRKTG